MFAGHLGFIIDLIPDTDEMNDVTMQQDDFTIITECRDDLISYGYDAEDLSDDEMRNVARVMGDLYSEYEYAEELRMAADKLNIAKK